MAFTDNCDLFGSVHEDGVNLLVTHLMRQRPSMFNYATPIFGQQPGLFCEPIQVDQRIRDLGDPLFTEVEPLPILGSPVPVGINFCMQFRAAQLDLHPGNTVTLPPGLGALPAQRFALRARACAGISCPTRSALNQLLPTIERTVLAQQKLVLGEIEEQVTLDRRRLAAAAPRLAAATVEGASLLQGRGVSFFRPPRGGLVGFPTGGVLAPPREETTKVGETVVLPVGELLCFCLELFAVGHFEWGSVSGSQQTFLKARVDTIEIVDLQPTPMENAIECFAVSTLQLGILPRLMVPMEKMVLDITKLMEDEGLSFKQKVTLKPSQVPNNPAVEGNQLQAFVSLVVEEGGA